jgi:beta-galactosidase
MAALSMQAVARGADGVLFFQWRQAAAGSEKFHSAMLPHAGPETRTYREVEMLGADLAALGALPAPGGEARVAIVLDWHNAWAIDQPDHPAQFDYHAQVRGWHAAFHQLNVQVDVVRAEGPFEVYDLVVVPSLYLIRDASALTAFVERGGRLLVTAFSDVVDEFDRLVPGGFTRRLGAALGLSVLDFPAALPGEATVTWEDGTFEGDVLAEVVRLDTAEVLGRFDSGAPAVTRNSFGRGEAYYLATMPGAAGRTAVVRHLIERGGIEPVLVGLPDRVEACARGQVVTLINHNPVAVVAGDAVLGPFGYRVIKQA